MSIKEVRAVESELWTKVDGTRVGFQPTNLQQTLDELVQRPVARGQERKLPKVVGQALPGSRDQGIRSIPRSMTPSRLFVSVPGSVKGTNVKEMRQLRELL